MHHEPFSMAGKTRGVPDSQTAGAQVLAARQIQRTRQACLNAHLDLAGLRDHCQLQEADARWLEQAIERLGLSHRASHRALKVARTLADLEAAEHVARRHLAEALQYRQLDRRAES
jgi:magnesium chelatase family protein